ncbi:hypothetical protein VNI00_000157 [Paramarasmius palmivorus]|uniref:S-adenosyl-L-methionine-dependent methyltransferase n=1 Tax=Paramarasmius palmivorus TaxID=297713 RepID=A0AAW0EFI4_9AGAR
MSHLWAAFADGADKTARPMKESVIPTHAQGVVLDLGAGYGHTIQYLDRNRVTRYVALEPNVFMHPKLRQVANQYGYTETNGSLLILGCGAEDLRTIFAKVETSEHPFDTIISVLTLCSIPSPQDTMTRIVKQLLKPGGRFLLYEHVRSPREDVTTWQRVYGPIWRIMFEGCRLGQPSDKWIADMKDLDEDGKEVCIWSEGKCWGDPSASEIALIWHIAGSFLKRQQKR